MVDVVDKAAPTGFGAGLGAVTFAVVLLPVPAIERHLPDTIDTCLDVLPELGHGVGTRKLRAHPDNGDVALAQGIGHPGSRGRLSQYRRRLDRSRGWRLHHRLLQLRDDLQHIAFQPGDIGGQAVQGVELEQRTGDQVHSHPRVDLLDQLDANDRVQAVVAQGLVTVNLTGCYAQVLGENLRQRVAHLLEGRHRRTRRLYDP
ncbi:hypothetical protein D3C84_489370 [compost metagenome]